MGKSNEVIREKRHGDKCLFLNKDSWGGVKKQNLNLGSKNPKPGERSTYLYVTKWIDR
jgi:hypothetical protein